MQHLRRRARRRARRTRRNRTGDDSDDALGLDDEIQQRRSRRSPIHSRADAPVHGRLVVVRRQDEVRPARRGALLEEVPNPVQAGDLDDRFPLYPDQSHEGGNAEEQHERQDDQRQRPERSLVESSLGNQ
jgi:hypothetical protein